MAKPLMPSDYYDGDLPETVFINVELAYQHSIIRLVKALSAFRLAERIMAHAEDHQYRKALVAGDKGTEELLSFLEKSDEDHHEPWLYSYRNFTLINLLVHTATLFDTFLSNTTSFLICLNPASIGSSTIEVKQLLDSSSRTEAINNAIAAKVRNLSFKTFNDRIEDLCDKFGLELTISSDEVQALEEATELRNRIVHDQSPLAISISESGAIQCRQDKNAIPDLQVANKQFEDAHDIFRALQARICIAVRKKHFKGPVPTSLEEAARYAARNAKSAQTPS